MVRLPSAQPVPRVPRSRLDDNIVKGHALCPKLGGVGIVLSREGDTCTVEVSDEAITGVIPLTSMPPVGAIVEVESRCDIMVVLDWTAGEPAQPQLGQWYFTADESPGWVEGDSDSPVGMGERVGNVAPVEGPGLLWNTTEIRVRPGDVLTFTMLLTMMEGSAPTTAQMVLCLVEYGADPQPATGEVVAYGTPVLVDGEADEFAATATVPSSFDKPGGGTGTPGHARLGIRFEAAEELPPSLIYGRRNTVFGDPWTGPDLDHFTTATFHPGHYMEFTHWPDGGTISAPTQAFVEFDLVSGTGKMNGFLTFDDAATGAAQSYFSIDWSVPLTGPGHYSVPITSGPGLYDPKGKFSVQEMVNRAANTVPYDHAFGRIEGDSANTGDVTISMYRFRIQGGA